MNTKTFLPNSLGNLVLPATQGAALPLAWLLFIILTKEDLLETWMYYPLTIIPIGGAAGGTFFYQMGFHRFTEGKSKLIAVIFSKVLYFISLWIRAVMAFTVTGHWN